MIDADVMRLRHLRNAALRARAVAQALASNSDNAIFSKTAVLCWSVARAASGQLRAHPYLSYQRGPSRLRALSDHAMAAIVAFTAARRGRRFSALEVELQCVARDVDDARALARLPDLSDSLGRTQLQLRRLAKELESRARSEKGRDVVSGLETTRPKTGGNAISGRSDWPYLAI
jgi:hypothetical protein